MSQPPPTPLTPAECREDWARKTDGENLALGKPAWFSSAPGWSGTQDDQDREQLTDGKLSQPEDGRILRRRDAVGWHKAGPHTILFDLGGLRPVSRIVARFLGGEEHPMVVFPAKIEVVASSDGETFHSVGSLSKLLPGEKGTADWKRTFFLPEVGTPYVHAFSLPCHVMARKIGLRVTIPGIFLVSDEIAVMKGEEQEARPLTDFPEIPLLVDAAGFYPRKEKLWVSENIVTPNWFCWEDTRVQKGSAEVTADLPSGLVPLSWGWTRQPLEAAGPAEEGRVRWRLPLLQKAKGNVREIQGPLYLQVKAPVPPDSAYALFRTESPDGRRYERRVPIESITIPDAGDWKGVPISLGWLWETYALSWPGFFENYRHLGFNQVPSFPRFGTDFPSPLDPDFSVAEKRRFLRDAKEKGFGIVLNESPFHVMKALRAAGHPEMRNEINGKPGADLSPLYRGPQYREEIGRVANHFAETGAEMIFYDIELWYRAVLEAKKGAALKEAAQKAGKSPDDYLKDLGSEMLADLRAGIEAAANANQLPMPKIGQYNLQPRDPVYHFVFDWRLVYPRLIDFAMPSLYIQGDAQKVHDSIRENYKAINARGIVPWLTAGTYGEFDPRAMEWMVYETLLNGALGLTYYTYTDFDPLDFYYHAKALQTLHPYRDFIRSAPPVPVSGSNTALCYSALAADGKCLLLVGNYHSSSPQRTVITAPDPPPGKVTELRSGKSLPPGREIELEVPAGGGLLLYLEP